MLMKKNIILPFILLLPVTLLSAQSDLKIIQAQLVETYEEHLKDTELHYCCQGFSAENLSASSTLKSQSSNQYHLNNLGDNDSQTAWIEGASDSGIGEFIEFDYAYDIAFAQAADGAVHYKDEWQILNGYQKSRQTWRDNGRVKRLKMYINEVAFCYIDLLDELGVQAIDLGFLDYLDKDKSTIHIKLEIKEVYPGYKYMDTALSEIIW